MDAPELVETAIRDHGTFKFVVNELKKRPPSEPASEIVVAGYRRGAIPPWLTAVLLGGCRDRVGYAIARQILLSAPRQLAESYAGVALAEIGGAEAFEDLRALMLSAPDRHSREGAAYGIKALGLPETGTAILDAVLAGKIRRETGGSILAEFADEEMVVKLLRTDDLDQVRLATEIIDACILNASSGITTRGAWSSAAQPSRELAQALRQVLSNPAINMAPRKRIRLWSLIEQSSP